MNIAAVEKTNLETGLRHALAANQFVLHYQPQLDIERNKTVGVEALVRWAHPELGLLQPAQFIPLAEDTGLIVPIGEWVIKTACSQVRAWQDAGLSSLRLAVNLSAAHFRDPGFVAIVKRILLETQLDPSFLQLEVTENLLIQDTERTMTTLKALKDIGIQLALDDFGTGYSCLGYLKHLPVNTLKIDRSFVNNVTTHPEDAALAKAIIAMAQSLRLRVSVEGVETEGQLAFFADQHCEEIQGYHFSRPLPEEECAKFLQQSRPPRAYGRIAAEHTMLLVDDEVNILNALKRLFRKEGYQILTADNGLAGLELLATHQVGVIISDQRMPEMTGVEFLRRVKELYPETLRIVLSGYADIQTITDAINEGAIYKFLAKPWEDDQLREQVREAFHRYELKQENIRLEHEVNRANRELQNINRDLQRRVAENTEDLGHNITVLQVSQEVLENLPIAVIGIDEDGLIVLANRQAESLFVGGDGESLLGYDMHARLPAALTECLGNTTGVTFGTVLADDRHVKVIWRRMGETCKSRGHILMISPIDGE
ncbi:EAL domain-containing protein [Methylomonas rapida]|uniref:EAL domain-containing protein n=1 Tax=Methylomonas rapida TaxID=2963939 RepID=A0ABY7GPC3_9GAMM|nr:EAL domain-containing protein [Methylomonas rapida]WAR46363.1 EAL domain-containing protein [Methylomonas rapida]